jgi:hypothetical protein
VQLESISKQNLIIDIQKLFKLVLDKCGMYKSIILSCRYVVW